MVLNKKFEQQRDKVHKGNSQLVPYFYRERFFSSFNW